MTPRLTSVPGRRAFAPGGGLFPVGRATAGALVFDLLHLFEAIEAIAARYSFSILFGL